VSPAVLRHDADVVLSRLVVGPRALDRKRNASRRDGCEALAPDVLEIEDDGERVVLRPESRPDDLPDVRAAAASRPRGRWGWWTDGRNPRRPETGWRSPWSPQ